MDDGLEDRLRALAKSGDAPLGRAFDAWYVADVLAELKRRVADLFDALEVRGEKLDAERALCDRLADALGDAAEWSPLDSTMRALIEYREARCG